MKHFKQIFDQNKAFQLFDQASQTLGNLDINEEAWMLYYTYEKNKRKIVIVKNNLYTAQNLYNRLYPMLKEDVLLFSVEESMRVEAIASSPELLAQQLETMDLLLSKDTYVCITHCAGLVKYIANPDVFKQYSYHLKVNDTVSMENMKLQLYEAGYTKVGFIDQPLTYASRGGIIDVFSMNHEHPIRIEFFDDEIESIRYFDIETKRTIQSINEIHIIPASDFLLAESQKEQIIHAIQNKQKNSGETLYNQLHQDILLLEGNVKERYLNKYYAYCEKRFDLFDYTKGAQLIISSKEEVEQTYKRIFEENIAYIQEQMQLQRGSDIYEIMHPIHKYEKQSMYIQQFVDVTKPVLSNMESIYFENGSIDKKIQNLGKKSLIYTIFIDVNKNEKVQIKHILDQIQDKNIGNIHFISEGYIEGFQIEDENVCLYTSKDLFNVEHRKTKFSNKFKEAEVLHNHLELEIGDFIVHNTHGVGKYVGIITKERNGIHRDYLHIIYRGDSELLVPVEQFKLIRKFVSKEGVAVKLNTLGSKEWEKTKAKVSENVKQLAQRLVKLYTHREQNIGYAYSKDDAMMHQFEEDFAYEPTQDQKTAIKEIKKDMESLQPMDRLLCGDVGFGKTEVAFVAAFKAILDNKQVGFLCPTTILSQQHFQTALKRFANYPVRIKVVNRFLSTKEFNQIKEDLKEGKIDMLIGTHRLFSKQLEFKDLGLLIIDEEQRFGVEHKEKIKELKQSIDVLSMSATPIPRTLQMSLIGVRALSQLHTPPNNRMSVQTYVVEKNMSFIKEVIERELSRDGQVFYLYNNVKEIYNVATKIRKQIKHVNVAVAHGQMSKEEIEDVMIKFTNKEYQVLVCTTIIETGIDIPNANTILIEDANRFGLSQLYQIKGRVGRSDRLAYAYLMYSANTSLSEIATKRLQSMKEFSKLGSGYKIALRDLTIRGAGDMLGEKQAGFIDTVGMDMYLEMLSDAIKETKGEIVQKEESTSKTANVIVDAYIPEQFDAEDYEKITLYQRLDACNNKKDLFLLQQEIIDTHGKLPNEVSLLFEKKRLDLFMSDDIIESIVQDKKQIQAIFTKQFSQSVDGVELFQLATTTSTDLQITYQNNKIQVKITMHKMALKKMITFLAKCENL